MNVKKHLILNLNRNELKSRLLTNGIDLFSDKKITCMNISVIIHMECLYSLNA